MKIKLLTDIDAAAFAEIAGLQNWRSVASLISVYADTECPQEEDFEVLVGKSLLPKSYRSNPSQLAIVCAARTEFVDSAGFQTLEDHETVTVRLLRARKPAHSRYTQPKPSVKRVICEWLELNLHKSKKLKLPITTIPAFYFAHPEQLTFQVKAETSTPIKITKLSTSWLISRK